MMKFITKNLREILYWSFVYPFKLKVLTITLKPSLLKVVGTMILLFLDITEFGGPLTLNLLTDSVLFYLLNCVLSTNAIIHWNIYRYKARKNMDKVLEKESRNFF
jgi:hypothetical protein